MVGCRAMSSPRSCPACAPGFVSPRGRAAVDATKGRELGLRVLVGHVLPWCNVSDPFARSAPLALVLTTISVAPLTAIALVITAVSDAVVRLRPRGVVQLRARAQYSKVSFGFGPALFLPTDGELMAAASCSTVAMASAAGPTVLVLAAPAWLHLPMLHRHRHAVTFRYRCPGSRPLRVGAVSAAVWLSNASRAGSSDGGGGLADPPLAASSRSRRSDLRGHHGHGIQGPSASAHDLPSAADP